ncbi:respiratory burst oxidase homolog protein A-like [Miscanthus floridulus]|uniref:respiratory burst oxidase homolog protein A-like n=1 Tax=Miscanthus floridulus TaxID=154761 RepID=UPI0034589B0C
MAASPSLAVRLRLEFRRRGGAGRGHAGPHQGQQHCVAERRADGGGSAPQHVICGLRFISGGNKASYAWIEVQANFNRLARDGYLSRADFPKCIGMTESQEFAMELFDTLSRHRQMQVDKINKDELREIWQQITDNSFDSRLQIFFDM